MHNLTTTTIGRRAAAAVVGLAVAAVLAVGALAVSHSDDSGLAARKLGTSSLAGGGKPVRSLPE